MDPAIFDKNKSVYKLRNFGPIYYLNLDGQPERRQYMEDQFKYWEIENYTRISAYDGREDDLSDILTESQQYRLCIDLLDDGYEVYINDNDAIMDMISNDVSAKYPDTGKFGEADVDVYPIKF